MVAVATRKLLDPVDARIDDVSVDRLDDFADDDLAQTRRMRGVEVQQISLEKRLCMPKNRAPSDFVAPQIDQLDHGERLADAIASPQPARCRRGPYLQALGFLAILMRCRMRR